MWERGWVIFPESKSNCLWALHPHPAPQLHADRAQRRVYAATSSFPTSFRADRPHEDNKDTQPRTCKWTKADQILAAPQVEIVILPVSESPCFHRGFHKRHQHIHPPAVQVQPCKTLSCPFVPASERHPVAVIGHSVQVRIFFFFLELPSYVQLFNVKWTLWTHQLCGSVRMRPCPYNSCASPLALAMLDSVKTQICSL